jgi:hypothetical protein
MTGPERRCAQCGEPGEYRLPNALDVYDGDGSWEHLRPTDHPFSVGPLPALDKPCYKCQVWTRGWKTGSTLYSNISGDVEIRYCPKHRGNAEDREQVVRDFLRTNSLGTVMSLWADEAWKVLAKTFPKEAAR